MIELFQETIPLSNIKSKDSVSKDGSYSNPIVMPLSLDLTSYNTVETIFYIRNNDKDKYYSNVFVSLLAPVEQFDLFELQDPFIISSIEFSYSDEKTMVIKPSSVSAMDIDTEYASEVSPLSNSISILPLDLLSTNLPISNVAGYRLKSTAPITSVKFSIGYDELSDAGWNTKKSSIILPNLGIETYPDNSYIPIRMRIYLNSIYSSLFSLRDYSIFISYSTEGAVI